MAITLNGTTGITTPDVDSTDLTATGNFTSRGIDDNATSTAMTLDTSGNLLVGTTSSFGSSGITLGSNKVIYAAASSQNVANFQRYTTDGEIVRFGKDGSTVGSIGTYNNDIYWGTDDTGLTSSNGMNAIMPFNPSTVAVRDSGIDLGINTVRFKDLYLSGGVYLGGTGSANKLDDYESGTWTPSMATEGGTNYTLSTANGYYRKVGSLVHVEADITFTAEGSGTITLISLPFTPRGNTEIINGYVTSGVSRRSIQLTHYSGANVLVRVDDGSAFTNYWSTRSVWSPTNSFRFAGTYIDNS